jgi:hypothetical protein
MKIEEYTHILQDFLQSRVSFKVNNKTMKSGTLKLFNVKQYFIKFYIETDAKEMKVIELPYPFLVEATNDVCTLNYKLTSICNNHQPTMKMLKSIKSDSFSKIHDNFVRITKL